jgi:hypothetical protein
MGSEVGEVRGRVSLRRAEGAAVAYRRQPDSQIDTAVATGQRIDFEQRKRDYLLWGCFRWSFASSSTPAGCLNISIHGLDEGARGAKSPGIPLCYFN